MPRRPCSDCAQCIASYRVASPLTIITTPPCKCQLDQLPCHWHPNPPVLSGIWAYSSQLHPSPFCGERICHSIEPQTQYTDERISQRRRNARCGGGTNRRVFHCGSRNTVHRGSKVARLDVGRELVVGSHSKERNMGGHGTCVVCVARVGREWVGSEACSAQSCAPRTCGHGCYVNGVMINRQRQNSPRHTSRLALTHLGTLLLVNRI